MKKMTEANLKNAFAGESQASMKYMTFARRAEEEGFHNIARLFRAIAYAEQVHATNHLQALRLISSTSDNLKNAIEGERYEVEEMYPSYNAVAKLQEERDAERTISWALQTEKIHLTIYQKALKAVEEKKDLETANIYICERCGYTIEGEPPERCPICGASREKFKEF